MGDGAGERFLIQGIGNGDRLPQPDVDGHEMIIFYVKKNGRGVSLFRLSDVYTLNSAAMVIHEYRREWYFSGINILGSFDPDSACFLTDDGHPRHKSDDQMEVIKDHPPQHHEYSYDRPGDE